jgi:uncharacterized protein HemY
MQPIGKVLVVFGLVIAGLGLALMFFDKIPFLGKLPGDITIRRENFRFFFPITSSIIVSIVLSAILWLISHFKGK